MSLSFNYGTGAVKDSTSCTPPTAGEPFKVLNFQDAFRKISDNGTQARIVDIKAPLNKRTTIKIALDKIADVYKTLGDGSIAIGNQNINTSGRSLFVELKTVATCTPEAPALPYDIPMVCRLEIRVPTFSEITDYHIESLINHTVAAVRDETTGNINVMSEKIRGALTPAGI